MSFLQTMGIASQASDAYDAQRQEGRLNAQREKLQQNALDEDALYRQVFQLAVQHEMSKEKAKARVTTAPPAGAVQMPTAPVAPGTDTQAMANGGPVSASAEKFNGIYDDTKVTDRLPTTFNESLDDLYAPDYKYGKHYHHAISDIVHHANLANGGPIDTNGVQLYANGGDVGPNPIRTFIDSRFGGKKPAKGAKGKSKPKTAGAVRGPGTGTSDSVPAKGPGGKPFKLSNGEYVLSADTVRAVGKPNLDKLQSQYHKKV